MIRIFNHFVPKIATLLFLAELGLLFAAPYVGGAFRLAETGNWFTHDARAMAALAPAFAIVLSSCMAAFGMYQLDSRQSLRASFFRLAPAFLLGGLLLWLLFSVRDGLSAGNDILIVSLLSAFGAVLTLRQIAFRSYHFQVLKSRVIFLGDSGLARTCIARAQSSRFPERYDVVGIVALHEVDEADGPHLRLPEGESLIDLARRYNVHEIVISVKNWRGVNIPITQLLDCKFNGVAVTPIARFFERETNQINIEYLQPSTLLFGDGFRQSALRSAVKRAVDLAASTLLLVATLPVMLATAVCIRLEDGGPVFYRQERTGKNGQRFFVLKFRSMSVNAEQPGTPQWAKVGDPRVTRVGRIIRKARIDELPQILNILKGEMSFVGPRPERPYFVAQLSEQVPYYDMRHAIKPGLTGLAQVRYQYGATVEDAVEKLQYDLYYIKNHSIFLDLLIIVDTIQVVLFARGSR